MSSDIKKVARTARIFLTQEEELKYQKNLDIMLPWFKEMLSLEEISDISLAPMYSVVSKEEERNYFPDEISNEKSVSEALSNTPHKKGSLIFVPKVIS